MLRIWLDISQRNPNHCYDLFEHTICTVCGIDKHIDSMILRIAAFFMILGNHMLLRKKKKYNFILDIMMTSFHGFFQMKHLKQQINIRL